MVTHNRDLAGQIPRVEEVRDGRLVTPDEIDQRLVARSVGSDNDRHATLVDR
jgi:hypothetical protein